MEKRLNELFSNIYYVVSRSSMDSVEKGMLYEWLNEMLKEINR